MVKHFFLVKFKKEKEDTSSIMVEWQAAQKILLIHYEKSSALQEKPDHLVNDTTHIDKPLL